MSSKKTDISIIIVVLYAHKLCFYKKYKTTVDIYVCICYSIVILSTRTERSYCMIKKYLIRTAGALCILGSLALIFMASFISLDGVKSRQWRELRKDTENMCQAVENRFLDELEYSDIFEDELDDCDLPHTRSKLKSRFKDVENMLDTVMDDSIAMKDVLVLSTKAPMLVESMEEIVESDIVSETFFSAVAEYVVNKQIAQGIIDYGSDYLDIIDATTDMYIEDSEDTVDMISELSSVFVLLTVALLFFICLGVVAAVTHMFNKVRWIKYLYIAFLIALVVGFCIAAPLVSDLIVDNTAGVPALEDLTLKITVAPFISVVLAIVPVVLDIVFERKNKKMEE